MIRRMHSDSCRLRYRERYYTGLRGDAGLRIKLTGNWETIIGEQDTFCERPRRPCPPRRPLTPPADHILEYENYAGFDKAWEKIRGSEVRRAH